MGQGRATTRGVSMKRNKCDSYVIARFVLITALVAVQAFGQQSALRILSPASGLVVRPGQTVTITVSADPAVQKLVLMGQHPLGMSRLTVDGAEGTVAQGQGEEH